VAGEPVPVRGLPHGRKVRLPNGSEIPAEIMAAAYPLGDGRTASFFALASLSLWRSDPHASKDPELDERILSVALHEIVHTRQFPNAVRRIDALRRQYELPDRLNDDTIEERFKSAPGYREAFEAERDLFYEAVHVTDAARRRELIAQGLAKARERRARFFTGPDAGFATVEDIFLNMEGAAEWARFRFHQKARKPGLDDDVTIIAFLRGKQNTWSQDEGLALILLLDQERPGWQEHVVSAEHASLFELLAVNSGRAADSSRVAPRFLAREHVLVLAHSAAWGPRVHLSGKAGDGLELACRLLAIYEPRLRVAVKCVLGKAAGLNRLTVKPTLLSFSVKMP